MLLAALEFAAAGRRSPLVFPEHTKLSEPLSDAKAPDPPPSPLFKKYSRHYDAAANGPPFAADPAPRAAVCGVGPLDDVDVVERRARAPV